MTAELTQIRQRLERVEERLDTMQITIDEQAGLRAMMDMDQATLTARFDAQDHLLRALAITQSEHGTQLRKLATEQRRMAEEQQRMAGEQQRMAGEQQRMSGEQQRMGATLDVVHEGVTTILGLLSEKE